MAAHVAESRPPESRTTAGAGTTDEATCRRPPLRRGTRVALDLAGRTHLGAGPGLARPRRLVVQEPVRGLVRRHRAGDEVPLREVAAVLREPGPRAQGLDAFGDDAQPEVATERCGGVGDEAVAEVGVHA